ncbi:MAG: transketolase C-terminal domain-containing protein [Patescibacteria group bacterium]|nr:transketolase C-terminal domain-containing protein [Patescibacteria group bacterium]
MKKELKSTRDGFGEGLLEAGIENENVVALSADLTESTRTNLFADKFPERFIQVGVAEQNLASVASGMAAMGKIPFMTSFAIFSPGRNWEQIRTTIAYNNTNVKIASSHAGVVTGPDGGSHQMLEDIALMRVIPRMTVFSPANFEEAKQMTLEAMRINGPVYLRLSRLPVQNLDLQGLSFSSFEHQEDKFDYDETKVGIIATGHLVHQAQQASLELEKEDIKTAVLNLSVIKPLDEKKILDFAKKFKALVTVEDHQLAGGMGSVVAEFLSQHHPIKIEFVAVKDQFGQSGTAKELLRHYNLDSIAIKEAVYKITR